MVHRTLRHEAAAVLDVAIRQRLRKLGMRLEPRAAGPAVPQAHVTAQSAGGSVAGASRPGVLRKSVAAPASSVARAACPEGGSASSQAEAERARSKEAGAACPPPIVLSAARLKEGTASPQAVVENPCSKEAGAAFPPPGPPDVDPEPTGRKEGSAWPWLARARLTALLQKEGSASRGSRRRGPLLTRALGDAQEVPPWHRGQHGVRLGLRKFLAELCESSGLQPKDLMCRAACG